jgi:hypothetical protein
MTTMQWDDQSWSRFVDEGALAANAGQVLDVEVVPDDGLEHTAQVEVRVSVVERVANIEPRLLDTFWEDSKSSSSSASTVVLEDGVSYLVTVQGNLRQSNDLLDNGVPDDIMFPSPGEGVQPAGSDAETTYASRDSGTYPVHSISTLRFDIGDGAGFVHTEPIGGPFSAPQPDHLYRYSIEGHGAVLKAHHPDTVYSDNNGMFQIKVFRP